VTGADAAPTAPQRRDAAIVAGHRGDIDTARAGITDEDPGVRLAALGALERCRALTDGEVRSAMGDVAVSVRRRAAELAARRPHLTLIELLHDRDSTVVEVAAWACGEHEDVSDDELDRLIELTTTADDALVREAAAAALGAIGDERGLPAIIAACSDKPHIRRRAVLALAPFDGPDVEATIAAALEDRDWQVRQSAEDLRRAIDGEIG
jgi:HEAT repeat protein